MSDFSWPSATLSSSTQTTTHTVRFFTCLHVIYVQRLTAPQQVPQSHPSPLSATSFFNKSKKYEIVFNGKMTSRSSSKCLIKTSVHDMCQNGSDGCAAATQISESEEENNNEGEVNQIYHPKMSLNCHVASFATSGSSTSSGNKINNNVKTNNTGLVRFFKN